MTGRVLLPTASAGVSFRVLSRLLFARRAAAVATLVTFTLTGIVALVPPWVLGSIVDDIRAGRDSVVRSAVIIVVASLAAAVLGALSVTFLARAGEPALAELREQAFDRVLNLDAQQIERAGSGDLLARLGDDVRSVSEGLSGVVPNVVNSGVAIAFTAVGVLALDWRLGLAMLVTAPIYAWGLRWYLAQSTPLYRDERIAQGQRAEALVNGIHAAPTVRAFGLEPLQLRHIEAASGKAMGLAISVFRLTLRFLGRNNLAELTGLLMLLVVGLYLVRADLTTLGAVTAATLYFQRLFSPIGALLFTFDQFQSVGAGLTRLVGIASLPPAPDGATAGRPGDILFSGISHEYTPGKPVLHDVTVKLTRGERIALVGSSGAGKTTLAAIAAGVLTPTRGTVTTDGRDYGDHRGLRPGAFLVSQEGHVFAGTVRDALTLARPAGRLGRGHPPGAQDSRGGSLGRGPPRRRGHRHRGPRAPDHADPGAAARAGAGGDPRSVVRRARRGDGRGGLLGRPRARIRRPGCHPGPDHPGGGPPAHPGQIGGPHLDDARRDRHRGRHARRAAGRWRSLRRAVAGVAGPMTMQSTEGNGSRSAASSALSAAGIPRPLGAT